MNTRDFDHYLACKSMLLKQCKVGIVNRDDEHFDTDHQKAIPVSWKLMDSHERADLRAEDAQL